MADYRYGRVATAGRTRWRRRTTSARRSTRSATRPRRRRRRATRCATCCAAAWQDRAGLDDLLRQVRERQRELRNAGRLDGTLEQVRELLDKAVEPERGALFPDPSDDARLREAELDALPNDTGARGPRARRLRVALAGGAGRRTSRSRTCCAARCSTASSAA